MEQDIQHGEELQAQQLLQELLVNNPELEELEALLDQFNIFEALGAIKQEVRHSDFLAFLLNPRENHGLGDRFVKRFLQEIVSQDPTQNGINPIYLDLWDLDEIEVRREWQSIDILLLDNAHNFVIVCENKIYSKEHSNQLQRYRQIVENHYPDFNYLFLFLTPEKDIPSDEAYTPIDYELVCSLIEEIVQTRGRSIGADVLMMMQHYTQMLRRYIVGESELERLCKQIYQKHQRALDLIYEYRPDQQAEIHGFLLDLLSQDKRFLQDRISKTRLDFLPVEWDFQFLKQGFGWTSSGRMLMLEFVNSSDSIKLFLHIGPGIQNVRESIYNMVQEHEPPFRRSFSSLGTKHSSLYSKDLVSKKQYDGKSTEELQTIIAKSWNKFLEDDFPKLNEIMLRELPRIEKECAEN